MHNADTYRLLPTNEELGRQNKSAERALYKSQRE